MIDVEAQFPVLLERCLGIVRKAFPITGKKYVLSAANWRWENIGDGVQNDIAQQRTAKLKESSITAKLVADLTIKDLAGKVIDRASHHVLLRVPHVTARSSYIVNGKELQVVNQLRLRPGLYTRLSSDNNVETFINTAAAGTYRIILDREKGAFLFRVGPSAHFPLPAVLRALGVSDDAMRKAWGQTIYDRSVEGLDYDHEIKKLLLKLRPSVKTASPEETMKTVREFLESKPFDPKVNLITVGRAYAGITGEAFLEASKKCLGVSQGKQKADDTESLAFKSLHSLEDFVPERLEKSLQSIVWEIQHRIDREPKIAVAVHTGLFTDPVTSFFTTSEFARHTDQSNPIDMIGANFLTTTMGEGGIGSVHAVTDAVRLVHPSHAGVLDGVHTPEGQKIGISGHLTIGAKKVGTEIHVPVVDARTGQKKTLSTKDLDTKVIAFPDQFDLTGKKPRPLAPMVKGRRQADLGMFKASDVDYVFSNPQSFFSSTSNMVPFLHNDDGNRVGMADRHIEQTIGLKDPDAPRVQAHFGARGYEEAIGHGLDPVSPVSGKIVKVTADQIVISDGKKQHVVGIHNNYPLNSDGFMHDTAVVKKGQTVKAGEVLARNSFTDGKGTLALGKNLRIAYMPYAGYNFEDGMVISQAAAQKLTSVHKYEEKLERDSSTKIGMKLLLAHYPDQVKSVAKRDDYDTDGVIKQGAVVQEGALLIPAVRRQELHADYDYAKLHRALSNQWLDVSLYWQNATPGTVIDVIRQHGFIKVILKTEEPARIGDKLSMRHGGKGIVTAILPDGEMYRDQSGAVMDVLFNPTGVVGRVNPGQMYEAAAGKVARTTGKTFYVDNFSSGSSLDKVKKALKDAGLNEHGEETVTDPATGKKFERVLVGDTHFLKLRHRVAKKFSARGVGGAYCYDPDTEVLTKSGWKFWPDVTQDDLLAAIHGDRIVFERPSELITDLFDGELFGFTGRYLDWLVTPNHRMWVRQRKKATRKEKKTPTAVPMADLYGRSSYSVPQFGFSYDNEKPVDQVVIAAAAGKRKSSSKQPSVFSAATYAEIVGWYVAEGSVSLGRSAKTFIWQSEEANPTKCSRIRRTLAEAGIAHHDVRRQGRVVGIAFGGQDLAAHFHAFGNTSQTKRLPAAVFEMARDARVRCLEALLLGDGHVTDEGAETYATASAGLADDVQRLCIGLGFGAFVRRYEYAGRRCLGYSVVGPIYHVGISRKRQDATVNPRHPNSNAHYYKLRYTGFVYCASVSTGLLYVRRNGKPMVCGNSLNEQPAKTEEGSAQRIGGLELYALLSGDATNFVKDAFGVKGQKNDAYWRAVQLGLPTPPPKPPMVSEKFLTYMQGAGIDLERRGVFLQAAPMTDAKVLASSNGAIKEPTVVTANDLKPEKGGLFDPAVTGGIGGEHWSHIELPEPIVHPLMAKAAASVLDIPEKDLAKLSEGSLGLLDGKLVDPTTKGAKTGGEAVRALLGDMNVEAELKKIGIEYGATRSAAKRDKLIKRRRFLEALKTLKMTPADAYTMKYVPVIPAKFRAVYPLPDGSLNVSDPIHGYREVLMVSNALRDMKTMGLDRTKLTALRRDLSGAVAGLVGTQEPLTRSAHFKGFLAAVKGASNKSGFFQGRVMSRPQDLSARSTIIPDPKFGLDQVGIPEKMALTIYKPFVVRRLVGLGHKPIDAREMVEKGDPTALAALAAEVKERPVILNRAPSLHKFNVMGFKPTLIQGEAIKINPLVVSGYNADFDGDTMGVHVPITEASRKEVLEKLLPSKNLFSPANDRVVNQPTMEMVLGLYLMSFPVGKPVKAASLADVVRGYMAKKHAVNAAFLVGGKTVCAGQAVLNQALPEYARIEGPMTKKVMSATIEKVARRDPKAAAEVLNKLKDLGNHYVTEIGFSVSLRDLAIDNKHRDAILDRAVTRAKTIGFSQASNEAAKSISTMVHADHANRFVVMSTGSGALGSKAGSVNRLVATPVAVTDHKGDAIPVQIRKSYAEGHDLGSYWATLPGARKGMMDKGLSTADTGYLTKRLVQANIDTVVSEIDCGTTRGVSLPADNHDIVGRFMVGGKFSGRLITPEIARTLKGAVEVRSPLTCMAKRGICSKCFGLNENGQLYPVGYHLGVLAAQTIGEPSTQLSLKAFHVGGAVGQGSTNKGFHRVDQLFTLPDNVKGRAILSADSGKITRIAPNSLGGWDVYVGKTKHYVPHEVGLGVKPGQTVAAGDHLSARGDIRPQDVLETTGSIDRVRTTLINELHDNFSSSGVNIKRRIYETVVKPMTKWAKVTDAGGSQQFHPGDVVLVDRIENENATLPANKKVMFEPMLVGVGKVPHLGDDFIGRMMHDRIIDTAREAAALGRRSNTGPDGHPVARLAFEGASQGGSPAGIRRTKVQ